MRAVVTPLRAPKGAAGLAAGATLDYLTGGRQPALSTLTGDTDLVGYFADQTPEDAGRWLGAGGRGFGLAGAVGRDDLEALLRGDDPRSGTSLLSTRGSAQRAQRGRAATASGWDEPWYTLQEAAELVGVSDRYLRRVAGRTRALLDRTGGDASTLATLEADGRAFLVAAQDEDGRWRVERDELLRFITARTGRAVTMGFDVTFSVPKSVSILWALGDAPTRAAVMAAFEAAVDAGVSYLDRHAAVAGRGRDRVRGTGLTAAAFTHATSRRLDPQLHTHVVVANLTETHGGAFRALDGTALYAHVRACAYLAGAQLRHELTQRLGVAWRWVRTGTAEVDGIPRSAIDVVSQRRQEIEALAEDLDVQSAIGRRALTMRSRTPKHAASLAALHGEWSERLTAVGFDAAAHRACLDRVRATVPPLDACTAFVDQCLGADGLTAASATFARQDVIEAVADWAVDRLDASGIEAMADQVLADDRVLALATVGDARDRRYTTRAMVHAETRVLRVFRAGVRAGLARVDPQIVAETLDRFDDLGDDQRAAITRLCRSGARIQCLVGAAGSGKTHTLAATAAAFQAAGYRVVGAAVQGTAAEHVHTATGIPSRTLASVLATIVRDGPAAIADARTILVVDEASTVGTLDLAELLGALEPTDARVVLIGDPAQHSAVRAGGAFAALVRRWPQHCVRLLKERRQHGASLTAVRQAVDELRRRDTDTALHRLVVDRRIQDAATRDAAYDAVVAGWAADRTPRPAGSVRRTCMITDDHRSRRELIARARTHLQATGELCGPRLVVAGQEFQVGDEVIARAPARDLHPPGAPDRFVRNGTPGRVTAVLDADTPAARLVVDFDRRGPITVPWSALTQLVRPGIAGVLTHSYALTSHAAQGTTFDTVHALATAATSPAGLYVAASRGRQDVRLYTAPRGSAPSETHGQRAGSPETGLQALARSVRRRGDERLAVEQDPTLADRVDRPAADAPDSELERDARLGNRLQRQPSADLDHGVEPGTQGLGIAAEPVI